MSIFKNKFLLAGIPFIVFLITYYTLVYVFYHKEKVIIPAFVGDNINDVLLWIAEKNINIKISSLTQDHAKPHGHIIAQYPSPLSSINKHMTVYFIVNVHVPLQVPAVIGELLDDAKKKMDQSGFSYDVVAVESFYPHNIILAVTSDLEKKHCILYNSMNQKKKTMMIPDLIGNNHCRELKIELEPYFKNILCYVKNNKMNDDYIHSLIIEQKPLPGEICELLKPSLILWHEE